MFLPVKPRCKGSKVGLPSNYSRCVQVWPSNRDYENRHIVTLLLDIDGCQI